MLFMQSISNSTRHHGITPFRIHTTFSSTVHAAIYTFTHTILPFLHLSHCQLAAQTEPDTCGSFYADVQVVKHVAAD